MPRMHPVRSWALGVAAFALIAGCSTAPNSELSSEPSIRPGVNDSYLRPIDDVNEWVQRFEVESREIYARRQAILDALDLRPGMQVADVGAGTGLFISDFSERVGVNGLVFAVDIVPEFLALVEQRSAAAGRRNVITVLGTERSIELPESSVDLIFLCDVYHHFEFPRNSLHSIRQALRPGGALVVVDFKRIPGVSNDWVLNHVRAGQEEVTREIQAAGFDLLAEYAILEENYMIRFRRRASADDDTR